MRVDTSHNIVHQNNKAIILLIGGEYCVEWNKGKDYQWFSSIDDAISFANKI